MKLILTTTGLQKMMKPTLIIWTAQANKTSSTKTADHYR